MSNKNEDKKSVKNNAVTGVEVVKDDTVVYEDGDFEEYNAEHDLEVDTDAKLGNDDKESDKDSKSKEDKSDKSDKKNKDNKKSDKKANDKDSSDEDDKSGITMAGIYQWATKLREDFKSDAVDMKHDVSEKATAMMLGKLLDAVDMELAAFDKSLDIAKNLIATAEERRKKIAAKKDKYQGMIDKLDQE